MALLHGVPLGAFRFAGVRAQTMEYRGRERETRRMEESMRESREFPISLLTIYVFIIENDQFNQFNPHGQQFDCDHCRQHACMNARYLSCSTILIQQTFSYIFRRVRVCGSRYLSSIVAPYRNGTVFGQQRRKMSFCNRLNRVDGFYQATQCYIVACILCVIVFVSTIFFLCALSCYHVKPKALICFAALRMLEGQFSYPFPLQTPISMDF